MTQTLPTASPQDYPLAERLDLVERLPAGAPTYDVADPYRWLEDADSPATVAWSKEQDDLLAAERDRWAARPHLQQRIAELLGAGVVSVPVWRGERQFVVRRVAGQEHAVLLTTDVRTRSQYQLASTTQYEPAP